MEKKDKLILEYLEAVDMHLDKMVNNAFESPEEYQLSLARLKEMKWRLLAEVRPEPEPGTRKYYFTFGTSGHIYRGGWVEIHAVNLLHAQQKFEKRYGDKARNGETGLLRYCDSYREERFKTTTMYKYGNFGECCHEVIV